MNIKRNLGFATIALLSLLAPMGATKTEATNPPVNGGCSLNIALMLDASGSVAGVGALEDVKKAAENFLSGIQNTKSKASMWWFGGKASSLVPKFTTVEEQSLANDGWFGSGLHRYLTEMPPEAGSVVEYRYDEVGDINSSSSYVELMGGAREITWTNWDDAFEQLVSQTQKPDLVVFLTDGAPSSYNLDEPGDLFHSSSNTDDIAVNVQNKPEVALARAVEQADKLKSFGTRIFSVGVGKVVSFNGIEALKKVSGPNVSNQDEGDVLNITRDDVLITSNFDTLDTAMQNLVSELCKGSITISKKLDYGNGVASNGAAGWNFQVGSPNVLINTNEKVPTDSEGKVNFSWDVNAADNDTIELVLSEEKVNKWKLNNLKCVDQSSHEEVFPEKQDDGTFKIIASSEAILTCEALNTYIASNGITVNKTASKEQVNGLNGGEEVTYNYEVHNIGEQDLTNLNAVDNKCEQVTAMEVEDLSSFILKAGESINFECKKVLTHELTTQDVEEVNTVDVTALDQKGSELKASDTAQVSIVTPSIDVIKTANETSILKGETVTYNYEVSNSGNTELTDVTVADDKCADVFPLDGDQNNDLILNRNEVWSYSCEMAIFDDTTNVVTVSGKDPLDNQVDASAELSVNVISELPAKVKGLTVESDDSALPFTGSMAKQAGGISLFSSIVGSITYFVFRRRVWL